MMKKLENKKKIIFFHFYLVEIGKVEGIKK